MSLFSKHVLHFYCPMDGEAAPLSETPDYAFSQEMMGRGVVIFPTGNKVYAPTDAKIDFTFPTRHAIALKAKSGEEYLIHVGIDTYKLNGKGFMLHVKSGDIVQHGQLLLEFDLDYINSQGLSPATPIVFPDVYKKKLEIETFGPVSANDKLLEIRKK